MTIRTSAHGVESITVNDAHKLDGLDAFCRTIVVHTTTGDFEIVLFAPHEGQLAMDIPVPSDD